MSIMFKNSNVGMEKELAVEDYRAHTVRNRVAILAVVLTTILITVIFTVGFSLVRTASLAVSASPGPGADGSCIYGDYEILERVRALPQVEWAAFARRCSSTYLHNREFSSVETRLFAADDVHYEKNMVDLIVGKYPEGANELLVSDTMSERLGLGEEVGIPYSLVVVVRENGEDVEKEIPMVICGYYNNPIRNVKDIYEEVYTDESFIATYNPELPSGHDSIYVKLNNLEFFRFGYDKDEKLNEVVDLSGAKGKAYKISDMSAIFLIPVFLIVLLIMFCGYFFIYNIFDISVMNDIRFYGEVKTIGMTSKQLRRMLFLQMNRIAFVGIIAGSLIGFGVGSVSGRIIVSLFADGIAGYYQKAGIGEIFLASAVFSWLTIYISTMKPFKIACHISPVEAARYGGKRKKGVFSVLSFALSGILFLVVYTLSMGYNVNVMRERYNETDFRITHRGSLWSIDEAYRPISEELVEKLAGLPFVENFRVYYQARTKPDYIEMEGEIVMYLSSTGEIAKDGEIAHDIEIYNEKIEEGSLEEAYYRISENQRENYRVNVMGMDAGYLSGEEKYFRMIEGEMDAEKFAKGNYVIYQRSGENGNVISGKKAEYLVHAGDEVGITFYDDVTDSYIKKDFTVMAVITCTDQFGTSNIAYGNLILTDEVFRSIYSDYGNCISRVSFDVSEGEAGEKETAVLEREKERYDAVQGIIEEDGNLQLYFQSKYETGQDAMEEKRVMGIIGMFLAGIVGLIGIFNVVNTVSTDVTARRLEYAAMQSIGMTKKQMEKDIFGKYARYIFSAVILAVIVGMPLTYVLGMDALFTGISMKAFLQAVAMFLSFSFLLCAAMAHVLAKALNRKSIVERLREVV